jgi:hypothetical protein
VQHSMPAAPALSHSSRGTMPESSHARGTARSPSR